MLMLRGFASAIIISGGVSVPLALAQTAPDTVRDANALINADKLSEDAENDLLIAEGNVVVRYEERTMRADRVVYDRQTGKIRATGNVVIEDADGTQRFADEVEASSTLDDGYAIGFSTRLANGAIATANSGVRQGDGINALDQVVYTACEVCADKKQRPVWSLQARRAVLNENNHTISYRDAVFRIADIPVFYLPFFLHPDPTSERRSGFLIPDIEFSQSRGFKYGQPYHVVISESSDLTITPTFFTRVRPLLEVDYRKRFHRGIIEVNGSFTFDSDFDEDGNQIDPETGLPFSEDFVRGHIFADGRFQINDNWHAGFNVERSSDDLFLRQFNFNNEFGSNGLFEGQALTSVSQAFVVGQDEDFYFEAAVVNFQDLLVDSPAIPNAPIVSPVFFGQRLFDLGRFGDGSITASGAILSRFIAEATEDTPADDPFLNPDSRRLSIGGEWGLTRVLPGGVVTEVFADARGDYFDLDPDANISGTGSVFRGLGSVGTRITWPLARPGKHVDLLFEPTVLGAFGVSNANDPAIPIEDSVLAEFDESNLFESNGFSNFDLYEGDGRLSVGFTATARFKSGPVISAIGGRRFRTQADPAFDAFSNLDGTSSDWLGAISANFGRVLELEGRARFDEDTFALNRVDARASTDFWRINASARYFQIVEEISPIETEDEGVNVGADFRLTDRFTFNYDLTRDIAASVNRFQSFGLTYADNCSSFSIAFTQTGTEDRTIGSGNSVRFTFSLRTIGGFGSNNRGGIN